VTVSFFGSFLRGAGVADARRSFGRSIFRHFGEDFDIAFLSRVLFMIFCEPN
jgi:hypothetical protein